MSFNDHKVTEEDVSIYGVISQPDTLTGTPEDNKRVFDALVSRVGLERVNKLIDALMAQGAAGEVGATPFDGVASTTVQAQIAEVQRNLCDYIDSLVDTEGAAHVGAKPFEGVAAATVQAALEAIQQNLTNVRLLLRGMGGAGMVGVTPFPGVGSTLLQSALQEMQRHIDDINAGIIPDFGVTWDKLSQDIVEEIEKPALPRASSELDDYTMETGSFTNAGAGWNEYHFRTPFEGVPVVTVTPVGFEGRCEVKGVTSTGFLYQLRKLQMSSGSVETETRYVANTSNTSTHVKTTFVTSVSMPEAEEITTDDAILICYTAIEYGGDLH